MPSLRALSLPLFVVASAASACSSAPSYAPLANGGVTGPAADCSTATPTSRDAFPSAANEPRLIGRFGPVMGVRVPVRCEPGTTRAAQLETLTAREFELAGSEIRFRFDGASAAFVLSRGEDPNAASLVDTGSIVRFTLSVDDKPPIAFNVRYCRNVYDVGALVRAAGGTLTPGVHEVAIQRGSEALFGPTYFGAVQVQGGTLLPPLERKRRIEVIGDSVACGHGNLGNDAACPFSASTSDAYQAYPALAARALGAELVSVCWSGKGVYQNDSDGADDTSGDATMPVLWRRTLPSRRDPALAWSFASAPRPEVVVIDLGASDITRDQDRNGTPDGFERQRFDDAISQLLVGVRDVYPEAHVFVALSPRLSDDRPAPGGRSALRDVLRAAVTARTSAGDTRVYFMELVEQGSNDSDGCDHHPNLEVHRIMADQLAGAIRSKTCW